MRIRYPTALAMLGALGVAGLHFFSFPYRDQAIVSDVRYFVHFAQRTAHGGVIYRDFFDPKTPLATWAGALLHAVGERIGIDPLLAIRAGYLALAAATALVACALQRRLAGGRTICGLLALGPQLGFLLLGVMPAIGNIPKLLMVLFAGVAALGVARGAWVIAGIATALSFLDWQIGALVGAGVLVAALFETGRERVRGLSAAALGLAIGLAPAALYLGAHDALGTALRQTTFAAAARERATAARRSFREDWPRRFQLIHTGCGGAEWALLLSLAGIPGFALTVRRVRHLPQERRAVAVAGIYHAGILAVSARELQGFGDLFALLHTGAFLSGAALSELWLAGERFSGAEGSPALRRFGRPACGVAVLLAVVVARPWASRATARLATPTASVAVRLADQERVARELHAHLAGDRVAYLGPTEIAFLDGASSVSPCVYWNPAVYGYFRASPEESPSQTLDRILIGAGATVVITDRVGAVPLGPSWIHEPVTPAQAMSLYGVSVYRRQELLTR